MSSLMVLGSALALLAGACAGSLPGEGELVWAVGGTEAKPGGAFHDTIEMWNQLHPNGPRVRIETLPDSTDDQRQQLSLELDARNPTFDILSLDVIWTGEFAENGWLEPLEDLRAESPELHADCAAGGPLRTRVQHDEGGGRAQRLSIRQCGVHAELAVRVLPDDR